MKTSSIIKNLSGTFNKSSETNSIDIYTNTKADGFEISTIELSSGVQISGAFSKVISANDQPIYLQTTGKSALAFNNLQLEGHSNLHHPQGFGTALGRLVGHDSVIEDMSTDDLNKNGIIKDEIAILKFEGGVVVKGRITKILRSSDDKILIITFENCSVTLGEIVLFDPNWGIYDMAVGENVVGVFDGAADCIS